MSTGPRYTQPANTPLPRIAAELAKLPGVRPPLPPIVLVTERTQNAPEPMFDQSPLAELRRKDKAIKEKYLRITRYSTGLWLRDNRPRGGLTYLGEKEGRVMLDQHEVLVVNPPELLA